MHSFLVYDANRCAHIASVFFMFHVNVSKLDLHFLMLQTLFIDAADVESRCCRHVMLDVTNIKF
jgi:hypothetical protein